jgi:hypothetical protein
LFSPISERHVGIVEVKSWILLEFGIGPLLPFIVFRRPLKVLRILLRGLLGVLLRILLRRLLRVLLRSSR